MEKNEGARLRVSLTVLRAGSFHPVDDEAWDAGVYVPEEQGLCSLSLSLCVSLTLCSTHQQAVLAGLGW
jgi:hypothetical protein